MMRAWGLLPLVLAPLLSAVPAAALERVPYTDAALAAAEAQSGVAVLHVSATWCGTCKAQERVLDALADLPALRELTILRVDYDAQRDVMQRFETPFRSTFVVLRNGREVARLSGDTSPLSIETLLLRAVAPD